MAQAPPFDEALTSLEKGLARQYSSDSDTGTDQPRGYRPQRVRTFPSPPPPTERPKIREGVLGLGCTERSRPPEGSVRRGRSAASKLGVPVAPAKECDSTQGAQAGGPRRKRPLSFGEAGDVSLAIDEPPPPLAGSSNSVSSPAKKPTSFPRKTALPPSAPSPPRPSSSPIEEIELCSDPDDPAPAKSKTSKKSRSSRASKATTPPPVRVSPTKTSPSERTMRAASKVKAKPRPSLEKTLELAEKIKPPELRNQFPTIASYVDHLAGLEIERPLPSSGRRLLEGLRIAFVNAGHWFGTNTINAGKPIPRNQLDQRLRNEMGIVAKQGGTLVAPEDFVPAPPAFDPSRLSDPELTLRAEEEGWTTHIIPFVPTAKTRPPSREQMLICLGPDPQGLSEEQLGRFVQVVMFDWVSQSINKSAVQPEWEYDPYPEQLVSAKTGKGKGKEKSDDEDKDDAREKMQGSKGKKKQGEIDHSDTSDESEIDYDEDVISPFGSQDYPEGEGPPRNGDDEEEASIASTVVHRDL
ncbi:hypothetical protein JCM21900_005462 [Sporobolomyces salmonicolor]